MAENDQPPPKVAPRVVGAPKIRQLYWCDSLPPLNVCETQLVCT